MWHTTDETPMEGAEVVAIRECACEIGEYRDGRVNYLPMRYFTHWAYAPGEEAE